MEITVVGSNQLLAEELLEATRLILGPDIKITACLSGSLTDPASDLYVCNLSQLDALLRVVPKDKVLVLNLTPSAQFFIRLAQIPGGEKVVIFNNRANYASRLADHCISLGIKHIEYITLAYEEMPAPRVRELLSSAKYIIGVDKLVGPDVLLSDSYAKYLHDDVVIIGAKRVASVQSACALVQWCAANHLPSNSDVAEKIRKAAIHTVMNQIIPSQLSEKSLDREMAAYTPGSAAEPSQDNTRVLYEELLAVRKKLRLDDEEKRS